MKRGGGKPVCVDVGQRPVHTAITNAQQIGIRRVTAKSRQRDEGIQTRAIVVDLPLAAADFTAILVIPIPASVSVPAPVRNRRHEAEDGVEGLVGGGIEAEIPA